VSSTYQRYTPTLSTWAVAKKSLVGENDILVATVVVRKASINLPDGMSNVLITESSDVVMSHRESDEKAYMAIVMRQEQ
jgi:hypothetical protein